MTVDENNNLVLNFTKNLTQDLVTSDLELQFVTSSGSIFERDWTLIKQNDNTYIIEIDMEDGVDDGASLHLRLIDEVLSTSNINELD